MRDRKDLVGTINPEGVQAAQLEVLLDIRDLLLTLCGAFTATTKKEANPVTIHIKPPPPMAIRESRP